ncbi:MAG: Hsp60 family chaperonin, partial [Candidatus Hodgkinia cicadicola]
MKTMFSRPSETIKANKGLFFGAQARDLILSGLSLATSAVSSTMGPKGRTVVIVNSSNGLRITKDGATVANEVQLQESSHSVGALLVKEVTARTNKFAGDGTTTAAVLLNSIITEGLYAISTGVNPTGLRLGIETAVIAVSNMLENSLRHISTYEEYVRIATIAANGDRRTGYDVADALMSVGGDGIVLIEESKIPLTELEIVEGIQFNGGYVSQHFVTNNEKMTCELEEPFVLLYDKEITTSSQLLPILESVAQSGRSLLIVADEIKGEALATLVLNKLRSNLKVLAVKVPWFGDKKKQLLEDIALITGGQVITSEVGVSLETVTLSMLGCAHRVISSKNVTMLVDGYGSKFAIGARSVYLKAQLANCPSEYEEVLLKERVARLSGGIAIIKVGGMTEVEVKERRDRVEDALNATKLAISDGVIAGGGSALLQISKTLKLTSADSSVLTGIEVLKKALQAPARQIITNAGLDASLIINKILQSTESDYGYDVMTGYYGNMFAMRVTDSYKVIKTALMCAASISALVINSNTLITVSQETNDFTS